ncbi:hypothetical protein ACSBR2_026838 [Camellia fascicularis]
MPPPLPPLLHRPRRRRRPTADRPTGPEIEASNSGEDLVLSHLIRHHIRLRNLPLLGEVERRAYSAGYPVRRRSVSGDCSNAILERFR